MFGENIELQFDAYRDWTLVILKYIECDKQLEEFLYLNE